MDRNAPVSLGTARAVRATDRALLCAIADLKDEVWIPKSVIADDSEVYNDTDARYGELVVLYWWAEDRGYA